MRKQRTTGFNTSKGPCLRIYQDDGGFSTVGMVVALLVSLSLVFGSAQIYRIQRAGAEIQEVADAAALAAEKQVGEFETLARTCDAILLSLGLTGTVAGIVGTAALCTPVTAPASSAFLDAAQTLADARATFSKNAASTLDTLQSLLPFLATLAAQHVAGGNSSSTKGTDYLGIAILSPLEGDPIGSFDSQDLCDSLGDAVEESQELAQRAAAVEEQAQEAEELKRLAWEHDCGLAPAYCMKERADALASMSGDSANPEREFSSWTFSVALTRAKKYYRTRFINEVMDPLDSPEDQADSVLRRIFFSYANDQLAEAYVTYDEDGFRAYLPKIPSNASELKETSLYLQDIFPITESDGVYTMHAHSECPAASEIVGYGSVKQMVEENMAVCPVCQFTLEGYGNVANASGHIENGFEYHYNIVAQAAVDYQNARQALEDSEDMSYVKDTASDLIAGFVENARDMANQRIEVYPPGSTGVIALVVDQAKPSVTEGLSNFSEYSGNIGGRIAISAATLVDDTSPEAETVMSTIIGSISTHTGSLGSVLDTLMDCWGFALSAYANGQDSAAKAVQAAFDSLSWDTASKLGTWVTDMASSLIATLGLQPANISVPRAVILNSAYVAGNSSSSFAARFMAVKESTLEMAASADALENLFTDAETGLDIEFGVADDPSFVVASIAPLGQEGPQINISFVLPLTTDKQAIGMLGLIGSALDALQQTVSGVTRWE